MPLPYPAVCTTCGAGADIAERVAAASGIAKAAGSETKKEQERAKSWKRKVDNLKMANDLGSSASNDPDYVAAWTKGRSL